MSFGGPIDSMINANKFNLRLINKRKRLKELASEYKTPHREFVEPDIPKKSKQLFEKRLKKIKKADQQRTIMIIVFSILITLILLYWIYSLDYSGVIEMIN